MFEWLLVMAGLALGATTCVLFIRLRPRRRAVRPSVTTAAATGQATIDGPATDWSWSVDPAGLFTSVSASSLELIGYLPSELVGQDVGMIMDPRELGRAEAMVTSLGVTDSGLSDLVISGLHRDGTSSWFDTGGLHHHRRGRESRRLSGHQPCHRRRYRPGCHGTAHQESDRSHHCRQTAVHGVSADRRRCFQHGRRGRGTEQVRH